MKSQEEIRKIATKFYRNNGSGGGQYTEGYIDGTLNGFVDRYTKCQEDKKYTESEVIELMKKSIEWGVELGNGTVQPSDYGNTDNWIKNNLKK